MSSGVFTVDPAVALRRLGQAGLEKPEFYLLKLIQAGVAAAAPRVDVQVSWWGTAVHYATTSPLRLEGVTSHLAVARAVCSQRGRFSVEYQGRRCHTTRRDSWHETCHDHGEARFFYHRWAAPWRERQLVRERCPWSPVPVYLDGVCLRPESWVAEEYLFAENPAANRLAFPPYSRATAPPRIPAERMGTTIYCRAALARGAGCDLVQDGVIIEHHPFPVRAIIDASGLATDLSGFKLRDAELRALLNGLTEEVERFQARFGQGP